MPWFISGPHNRRHQGPASAAIRVEIETRQKHELSLICQIVIAPLAPNVGTAVVLDMYVNISYDVCDEHILDGKGGCLPRREDYSGWDREGRLEAERTPAGCALIPRRHWMPLCIASHGRENAGCLLPSVERCAQAGLKEPAPRTGRFLCSAGVANVEFVEEVIAHKDRMVRFGFSWFERFCAEHGTELLALNAEQLSLEQEMVQDLLTIVSLRVFSTCAHI